MLYFSLYIYGDFCSCVQFILKTYNVKFKKQSKPEAKILHKKAEKIQKIADGRNRKAQDLKAEKAKKTAKSYGDLESLVGGESAERAVSEPANKLKKK